MTFRLQDKIFISTRPNDTSNELVSLLNREGATVLELPLIEISATQLSEEENQHFTQLHRFDWIIFTSANGVYYFFKILMSLNGSYFVPEKIQFAVIGEKTGKALKEFGYNASFVNPGSTAGEFAPAFMQHIENEDTKPAFLLPLGNLARNVIFDQLKNAADCVRIDVYKTEIPFQVNKQVLQQIEEDRYDMLIFTSPSGITNFLKASPESGKKNIRMACIGQVTSREAIENGFKPLVTAHKSSAEGIVDSIINYYISKT